MAVNNNPKWSDTALSRESKIQDAIKCLDETGLKIVLVIDGSNKLIGTISDGDIRRGLLSGLQLDSGVHSIIHKNALVVHPELSRESVLQLMVVNKIQQIPVVDGDGNLVGLHLWDEVTVIEERKNLMIVMAGGFGKRLMPLTESCPKPMLPIAGKPMLEHIIERAKADGFVNFIISINYLGHIIKDYFGDGSRFGVQIGYLEEENPLGTAGALSLLGEEIDEPFLVTNGDVITDIGYGDVLNFHERHQADATMAVRLYELQNPYGVVRMEGTQIVGFEEKPVYRSHINAGVYVLTPRCLRFLTPNQYCDMPALFETIRERQKKVVAYPMFEPWLDVGRPNDLDLANAGLNKKSIHSE
nr:nucleotidyltransferase family protein [Polynucleobacter sp. AP-Kaivos-20-H2]